jgi:hypothetical protein
MPNDNDAQLLRAVHELLTQALIEIALEPINDAPVRPQSHHDGRTADATSSAGRSFTCPQSHRRTDRDARMHRTRSRCGARTDATS